MERRQLLIRLVQGLGAFMAGTVLVPGAMSLVSPVREARGARWRPVGALDAFPVGEVTEAVVALGRDDEARAVGAKSVYVWRPTASDVVVYSRSCTDLGCPVTWDPGSGWFFCPCHGGIFAQDGERRAGPPQRPLYRYQLRVAGGVLEIDLGSVPPVG